MRISDWSSDVCSSDLTFTHDLVDARGHRLVADEPVADGGADLGTSPFELLASGLAVCTSITILVYARQRALPVEIGRASCRERVCQYVSISVVAGSFKNKHD